jgi:hypothetical protein
MSKAAIQTTFSWNWKAAVPSSKPASSARLNAKATGW